jgi:amidohydrolase
MPAITRAQILETARKMQHELSQVRRDFHMHPELGFQEHRTADTVARTLRDLGVRVETGVGITGVVGHLGEGKPVVAIRADMDALPIVEANDVPYASQTPGVMHACGHDAHTAVLLGVAKVLSQLKDRPAGEVRFLFQPSEEGWDAELKSGAVRMIEDGCMKGVDAVISLHVAADIESGKIEVEQGYFAAAVDSFKATILGAGSHGASPHKGIDPIFLFAQAFNAMQGIRSRRVNPVRGAVVSVGSVHGGSATNIIPDKVEITGTLRSFEDDTRQLLWRELEKALGICRSLGGDFRLTIEKGYPGQFNAAEVVNIIRAVVSDQIGADQLVPFEPDMGAEDFAYMTELAPGAMFLLGVKGWEIERTGHSPTFDIDEKAMPIGLAILAETTCRLLETKGPR